TADCDRGVRPRIATAIDASARRSWSTTAGMRSSFALAALLLVACKGGGSPATQPNGSGTAASGSAAADPWQQPDAGIITPEERKRRAEAALARVTTIQPKLAALRGLPLQTPVPAEYQSTADFRTFVQRELAKELPPEKAEKLSAAQVHIGLFTRPIDLAKVLEQTMTSQAAAYYDP